MKLLRLLILILLTGLVPSLRAHLNAHDALDESERQLKEHPSDVSLLQEKAYLLISLNQGGQAEDVLKQIDELEKERDANTTYLYILLYHKRGDLKKAMEISDWGIKQFPDNYFQWEIRGRVTYDAGKTEEAITAMTQSLRTRKIVNSPNYIQITNILLERNQAGDKERALALLEEGIARIEHPSELLHLSIRLNTELGRYDQALEEINHLEEHDGKQVAFAVKRAEVLEDAGRNAEAANAYRSAIARLEALPEKEQNKQVTQLKKVFQMAVDELSALPDGQSVDQAAVLTR